MQSDKRPGTLTNAIGLAFFVEVVIFVLIMILSALGLPNNLYWWFVTNISPALFFIVVFAPYANYARLDALQSIRQHEKDIQLHMNEIERLKAEYRILKHNPLEEQSNATIDNQDEVNRKQAWRTFWITVCQYSLAHNSIVSWKDKDGNGLKVILPAYADWYSAFALPFVKHNPAWLSPVYGGSKTKLADGITISHILNELSANRLPSIPYGSPPELEQATEYARPNEKVFA